MELKRLIIILFALVTLFQGVEAQRNKPTLQTWLSTGFFYGYNYSNANWVPVHGDFKMHRGMNAGLILDMKLNRNVSFLTGFCYETKGYDVESYSNFELDGITLDYSYTSFSNNHSLKYLNIPLQLSLTTGKKFKMFLASGMYLSYLLDADVKYVSTIYIEASEYSLFNDTNLAIGKNTPMQYEPIMAEELYKKLDYGIMATVGFKLEMGKRSNVLIGTSYKCGLNYIDKSAHNIRNSSFSVNFAFVFMPKFY